MILLAFRTGENSPKYRVFGLNVNNPKRSKRLLFLWLWGCYRRYRCYEAYSAGASGGRAEELSRLGRQTSRR